MKTVEIKDNEVIMSRTMYESIHVWVMLKGFLLGVAITAIGFLSFS